MQVLITTSPLACVAWPPRSPNTVKPSSRARTIGSGMLQHPLGHDLTAADGHDDPPAKSPALEGRVLAAALERRRIDGPLFVRVDQDPLVFQGLPDNLSRPRDAGAVDDPSIETKPEDDVDRRLEAVEAERARLFRRPLAGRVVGRDGVVDSLRHPAAEGLSIVRRSQRWIHVPLWARGPHVLRRERQVVRGRFGGHVQAFDLGRANQLDGAARTHVLDMKARFRYVAQ